MPSQSYQKGAARFVLPLLLLTTVAAACGGGDTPGRSPADGVQMPRDSAASVYDTTKVVPPPLPRNSPMASARITVAGTYLKIVYGVPLKNGRVVFGALEPFGEVWRLGANETTELSTSGPVELDGLLVDAGIHSLFAIPEPDRWTLIVNKGLGQWGAFSYDESLDVGRIVEETRETGKVYEAFTVWFDESATRQTNLHFAWDRTEVVVPIRVPL